MKLHNKTRCPDLILAPLLVAAGRKVGANTGKVLVRVSQGKAGVNVSSGLALRCDLWGRSGDWTKTDGGTFSIVLPSMNPIPTWMLRSPRLPEILEARKQAGRPRPDALFIAQDFFDTALHEWKHIADYQAEARGAYLRWDGQEARREGRNRKRHDARPEELRAIDAVNEAKDHNAHGKAADEILVLAVWLDSQEV